MPSSRPEVTSRPKSFKTIICTVALGTLGCLALTGQTNVLTYHNDIGRTGQNVTETILTPVNVTTTTFGKRLTLNLDGQVLAQPLYMSGLSINGAARRVLFVATAHDSVYAFDAVSGAQLWTPFRPPAVAISTIWGEGRRSTASSARR